ncbi:MAG: metallophosphoesterase [Armatimonadota bacterium]
MSEVSSPSCRFVQIADVHYEAVDGEPLPLHTLPDNIPETNRVTAYADQLLASALTFCDDELAADFIIFTGDQVDAGWDEAGLKNQQEFSRCVTEYAPDVPVRFMFGNHDRPRSRYVEMYGESIYSFTEAGCHFAVLDSGVMEGEEDPGILEKGLRVLEETLEAAGDAPVAVFSHFYIEPTDIEGYSYRAAKQAREIIEKAGRAVPVINGHFHAGRISVRRGNPYFTASAFIEPPVQIYLHELARESLRIHEYSIDPETGLWRGFEKCFFDLHGC